MSALTDEEIVIAATQAIKCDKLCWAGFAMGDTWREALRSWGMNFKWVKGANKWVKA